MSYSYPTRVVNGYWLRVFFVVLVFRLSNSVSVFILFREWVGPTKVHKNLGTFEEEEAHWVWVSELCRCWFCFFFFWWTPHGNWAKIFISTFSTTIDIQRFKLKTFSLIHMYIFFLFHKDTPTNTVYCGVVTAVQFWEIVLILNIRANFSSYFLSSSMNEWTPQEKPYRKFQKRVRSSFWWSKTRKFHPHPPSSLIIQYLW